MRPGVTVVIPTIPPRTALLHRAIGSVLEQTRPADAISVATDTTHAGSAATRNRALAAADTEWCAFLDDDDQLKPNHLECLLDCADAIGADVVYPCPDNGPALRFGRMFCPDTLRTANYIPVTVLARTDLVKAVGGFQCPPGSDFDDWGCWLALLEVGAQFVHLPERTWIWNFHRGSTAGRPDRW